MNMKPDYLKAKAYSKVILEESFITEPPVNPAIIANNYGIKIISALFEEKDAAGFLDFEEKAIYVLKTDPINRQIFTIAHELGHWFLHQDKQEEVPALYRRPLGKADTDPIEKEANAFAANLLVPTEFLNKYKDDYSISELAKIFNVSVDVIGYRLSMMFA